MSVLETEIAKFEAMKAELESLYLGKFVVIKGDELVGTWDTMDAAATVAVQKFGKGPFLIRQVGAPNLTIPASVFARLVSQNDAHN